MVYIMYLVKEHLYTFAVIKRCLQENGGDYENMWRF